LKIMMACSPALDTYQADYAGHCPACHHAVLYSAETDGPVWTCPADLSPDNPHHEDAPDWLTEEVMNAAGCYSNCATFHGGGCPYDDMPLHGECYGARAY
jgi:hypothetical protein